MQQLLVVLDKVGRRERVDWSESFEVGGHPQSQGSFRGQESSITLEDWLQTPGLFVLSLDSVEDDVVLAQTFFYSPSSSQISHYYALSEHTTETRSFFFFCVVTRSGVALFWRFRCETSSWTLFCDHDFNPFIANAHASQGKNSVAGRDSRSTATLTPSLFSGSVGSAPPAAPLLLRHVWLDETQRCIIRLEECVERVEEDEKEGEERSVRVSVHDFCLLDDACFAVSPAVHIVSLTVVVSAQFVDGVLLLAGRRRRKRGEEEREQECGECSSASPSCVVENVLFVYNVRTGVFATLSLHGLLASALREEEQGERGEGEERLAALRSALDAVLSRGASLGLEFVPHCVPLSPQQDKHSGGEQALRVVLLIDDALCVLRVGENNENNRERVRVEAVSAAPPAVQRALRHSDRHTLEMLMLAHNEEQVFVAYAVDDDALYVHRVAMRALSLSASRSVDDDLVRVSLRLCVSRSRSLSRSATTRAARGRRQAVFLAAAHCERRTARDGPAFTRQTVFSLPLMCTHSGILQLQLCATSCEEKRDFLPLSSSSLDRREGSVCEMLRHLFPALPSSSAEDENELVQERESESVDRDRDRDRDTPRSPGGYYRSAEQFLAELMRRHVNATSIDALSVSPSWEEPSLSPDEDGEEHWLRSLDLFSLLPAEHASRGVDWAALGEVVDAQALSALLPHLLASHAALSEQRKRDREILESESDNENTIVCVGEKNEEREAQDEEAVHDTERDEKDDTGLGERETASERERVEAAVDEDRTTRDAETEKMEKEDEKNRERNEGKVETEEKKNEKKGQEAEEIKEQEEKGKREDQKQKEKGKQEQQEQNQEDIEDENENESFLRDVHSEPDDDEIDIDIFKEEDAALSSSSPLPFLVRAVCLSHCAYAARVLRALLEIRRRHVERMRRARRRRRMRASRRLSCSALRWSSLSSDWELRSVASQPDKDGDDDCDGSEHTHNTAPVAQQREEQEEEELEKQRDREGRGAPPLLLLCSRLYDEIAPWTASERVAEAVSLSLRGAEEEEHHTRSHSHSVDELWHALDLENDAHENERERESESEREGESELAHCAVQFTRSVLRNVLRHNDDDHIATRRRQHNAALCERALLSLGESLASQDVLLSLRLLAQSSSRTHNDHDNDNESNEAVAELALTLACLRRAESVVALSVRVAASLAFLQRELERFAAVAAWSASRAKRPRVSLSSLVHRTAGEGARDSQRNGTQFREREEEETRRLSRREFFSCSSSPSSAVAGSASSAAQWLCRYFGLSGGENNDCASSSSAERKRESRHFTRDLDTVCRFARDDENEEDEEEEENEKKKDIPRELGVSLSRWPRLRRSVRERRATSTTVFFVALEHVLSCNNERKESLLSELVFYRPISVSTADVERFASRYADLDSLQLIVRLCRPPKN